MKDQIQRLGFEAWCDNIVADALENVDEATLLHYGVDNGRFSLRLSCDGKFITATIRAYVEGEGWKYYDNLIKVRKVQR